VGCAVKQTVENALALCGRDRVMQNEIAKSIAIRWDDPRVVHADGNERYLVRKGDSLDASGEAAARAFAARIREQAKQWAAWADHIDAALEGK
jgi:hypothetical protein